MKMVTCVIIEKSLVAKWKIKTSLSDLDIYRIIILCYTEAGIYFANKYGDSAEVELCECHC